MASSETCEAEHKQACQVSIQQQASPSERLEKMGVRVHSRALGGFDLTGPAGKMAIGDIVAVAQFERDLLIERAQSGLKPAGADGAVFGRLAMRRRGMRVSGNPSIA